MVVMTSSHRDSHQVSIVEDRGFARPECSCGWQGGGYRSRATARAAGTRHTMEHGSSAREAPTDGTPTG